VVILIGLAFLSASAGSQKAAEKVMQPPPPVGFNFRLPVTVNKKISKKIQENNQVLLALLIQLREMPLDSDGNIAKAAQMMQDGLKNTYLNRARLIMDNAKLPSDGWKAIVRALKDVVKKDTEFFLHSVEAQVFYVPFAGAPNPERDIDMKILIRSTVIIGPHNDYFEGWLCHRRTCDPIPCDEDGGER
jgi:hypothetical protein